MANDNKDTSTGSVGWPKALVTPLTVNPDPNDDNATPPDGKEWLNGGGFTGGPADPQSLFPLSRGGRS